MLDEGDRIVALENWDTKRNNENLHSLHDVVTWRDQMTSVVEISAFQYTGATMRGTRDRTRITNRRSRTARSRP